MNERNIVLATERVRLEPLATEHLPDLTIAGNDPALWEFTFNGNPFTNSGDTQAWFSEATSTPNMLTFAIVDIPSGTAIGSTRLFEISEQHRKLEIGWTWIARRFWRTHVNSECKYLLFRHAFETWKCNRVQLKGEAINARSRAAMERIGATYEGTLRSFRIHATGEVRDTSFYSVIAPEWPAVKGHLEENIRRSSATMMSSVYTSSSCDASVSR